MEHWGDGVLSMDAVTQIFSEIESGTKKVLVDYPTRPLPGSLVTYKINADYPRRYLDDGYGVWKSGGYSSQGDIQLQRRHIIQENVSDKSFPVKPENQQNEKKVIPKVLSKVVYKNKSGSNVVVLYRAGEAVDQLKFHHKDVKQYDTFKEMPSGAMDTIKKLALTMSNKEVKALVPEARNLVQIKNARYRQSNKATGRVAKPRAAKGERSKKKKVPISCDVRVDSCNGEDTSLDSAENLDEEDAKDVESTVVWAKGDHCQENKESVDEAGQIIACNNLHLEYEEKMDHQIEERIEEVPQSEKIRRIQTEDSLAKKSIQEFLEPHAPLPRITMFYGADDLMSRIISHLSSSTISPHLIPSSVFKFMHYRGQVKGSKCKLGFATRFSTLFLRVDAGGHQMLAVFVPTSSTIYLFHPLHALITSPDGFIDFVFPTLRAIGSCLSTHYQWQISEWSCVLSSDGPRTVQSQPYKAHEDDLLPSLTMLALVCCLSIPEALTYEASFGYKQNLISMLLQSTPKCNSHSNENRQQEIDFGSYKRNTFVKCSNWSKRAAIEEIQRVIHQNGVPYEVGL